MLIFFFNVFENNKLKTQIKFLKSLITRIKYSQIESIKIPKQVNYLFYNLKVLRYFNVDNRSLSMTTLPKKLKTI